MVETSGSAEDQIRALVQDWARAVRSGDIAGAVKHHADDIVMFDVPLPLQSRGIGAYKATWELFFSQSSGGEGSFDLAELEIIASDTVAFCHGLIRVVDSTARLTMGLRKAGDQWIITHEHHSYPLELDP